MRLWVPGRGSQTCRQPPLVERRQVSVNSGCRQLNLMPCQAWALVVLAGPNDASNRRLCGWS